MDSNPFEPHGLEAAVITVIVAILVAKGVFWLVTGAFILKTGRMPRLLHKLYLARHPRPPIQLEPQKHEHEHVYRH